MSSASNHLGVPSSAVLVSSTESTLKDVFIIDKDYFSLPDRHKFMDLVNKYQYFLGRQVVSDRMAEFNSIHLRCNVCVKLMCPTCFGLVVYDKSDYLEPYCDKCEMFFHLSVNKH